MISVMLSSRSSSLIGSMKDINSCKSLLTG
jgi:hypothetical protein